LLLLGEEAEEETELLDPLLPMEFSETMGS
jgi:hypothetical protein